MVLYHLPKPHTDLSHFWGRISTDFNTGKAAWQGGIVAQRVETDRNAGGWGSGLESGREKLSLLLRILIR